ncbi:hypothetical protein SIID45300_01394 [Candidatus Magnetaquicoccaceae bacterium FCR-1]|uniref:Uncharacterized protein n=1 Tax=Candidatus Magnetaquiglobus chichijimensis TaxID=3141448 RepID=A0ABQ0C854_9PROT
MRIDPMRIDWLLSVRERLPPFLASLRRGDQPGAYNPCPHGSILAGEQASLGFSCFAKKILDALGLWESLPEGERNAWLEFIRAYQRPDGTFVDPALLAGIARPVPTWRARLKRRLKGQAIPDPITDAILAETKQAIATLAASGQSPRYPYAGFPHDALALENRLKSLDWHHPWSAGAKTAILALFVQSQGPRLPEVDTPLLRQTLIRFLASKADPESGAYFAPPTPPARGQLINGAMKVLNALEWLEEPIHHPERLIDTCLLQGPPPAGCHVVDWIYVLHRAARQTGHRRAEIEGHLVDIMDRIRLHQAADGGFSYLPGQAQSGYYGATISRGLNEGDIHGTCLLTWGLAMCVELLAWDLPGWKPFRA